MPTAGTVSHARAPLGASRSDRRLACASGDGRTTHHTPERVDNSRNSRAGGSTAGSLCAERRPRPWGRREQSRASRRIPLPLLAPPLTHPTSPQAAPLPGITEDHKNWPLHDPPLVSRPANRRQQQGAVPWTSHKRNTQNQKHRHCLRGGGGGPPPPPPLETRPPAERRATQVSATVAARPCDIKGKQRYGCR